METESLLRERALLPEEQEALKGKYKKALQELTRLLKVNKSLKDSLDSHAQALQERLAQQQAEDQQRQLAEIEVYRGQIEHYKYLLEEESSCREQIQLDLNAKEEELLAARAHSQQLQGQLRKIEEQSAGKETKVSKEDEYPSLRERISEYLQVCRQKDILSQECSQLKARVSELTLALVQQRQRCRSQIFTRETELLRSKESQFEKMRTMQSKYQLLQSELNNYKSAEKYFEEEANSLLDEETVYNSIRQQITRISQDFNKYQLESSQLLLKKREEDAERNRKIVDLEREVSRLKGAQDRLGIKEKEGEVDRAEREALKTKIKQLQAERDQQTGKNHVLQALAITDKHRVHPSISERIRQFETRVKVLLEEVPPQLGPQAAGAHQVVVLKGCVQELSEMLRQAKRKEDHITKRQQHYKQKLATAEEAYRTKIGVFKAKIKDYDVLVGKLYAALQQKFKERIPVELQREFNSAIGHYQQKMVVMSEQILKLRAKVAQLQGVISGLEKTNQTVKQVAAVQAENQDYKEIISELSVRINELQQHAERTAEAEQQLREKDRIIDSLAKEVNTLNTVVANGKQREAASASVVQEYERQVLRFREELQQKQRISSNLSRNSIDKASLIEKVNYLQYELDKTRKPEPTPKPDDYVISLESKLSAQGQQIAQYKAEVQRLYAQLRTEKEGKRSSAADQFSQIGQLQKQISDWELRVLALQEEFHGRQAQYKDELESARFQSRSLIEQLNSKHAEMMGYYEELTRKTQLEAAVSRLPELERYVMELQRKNHEIIERSSNEANELNASILALRTTNLALRNELQNKEDAVNELKHQLFNAQLRSQKERPNASMSASFSGSIIEGEREREREALLVALVLLAVQVDALRGKKEELEAMYHQDLDKYRQALKQLETRQMELCNSLQLSSQPHEGQQLHVKGGRQVESRLQLSEQGISHLSQESNTFLSDPHKPLQATIAIRSHEHYPENPPSNSSIQASPRKRRGVTVKKIG